MLAASASTALRDFRLAVELQVRAGSSLALAGPSGAGKTSVLRIVAGLFRPESGRVTCDGEPWLDTARALDLPPEHRGCGFLFQGYALFPHLRAWENVAYGLRGPRRERRLRAVCLLDRFGASRLADARPHELSGGERQRVALARALSRRPRALLLDEPLSALDTQTRTAAARELAAAIAEAGVPTLLVTHDFTEASLLADEVAIMDAGSVVQRGAATQLAASPASPFVADFTGSVVLIGNARRTSGGLTTIRLDGGGEIRSTDVAIGPVAASVLPWEITVEPPGERNGGSALNRLDAEVLSVTAVGNRARIGLLAGQHLTAEITNASASRLGLARGSRVTATWKATATRLIAR
jgi:molybdate transport system ATP-binding protein